MSDEELLEFYGHPPVKEGYVRVYLDHTGRYYEDVPERELQPDDSPEWELMKILNEEIKREILKQDVNTFLEAVNRIQGTIKLGISLGDDFVKEIRRDFEWYKPFIIQTVLETELVKREDLGTLVIRNVPADDENFTMIPNLFFIPDGKNTIDTAWGLK